MLRKLAVALAAVVSLGVASIPTGAIAGHGGGGGGGGHGGGGGGHGGGFSGGFGGHGLGGGFGPSIASHGITGGNTFIGRGPGNTFVTRGVPGNAIVSRGVPGSAFVGRNFATHAPGRFAFNGRHHHFHRIFGFLPGFGYGYYWYDDGCWAWTDSGYINLCSDYNYN
jgi:hypothetical protein